MNIWTGEGCPFALSPMKSMKTSVSGLRSATCAKTTAGEAFRVKGRGKPPSSPKSEIQACSER